MNHFHDFINDPHTIDCMAWVEPHKPLASLPRMRQDKEGLQAAAQDIVKNEGVAFARTLLDNPQTDRRLLKPLRSVLAWPNYQEKAS